jgi:diacylglycerol O-acyltransferase / wax synthase
MIPLGAVTGNVTVAFSVLSYADTLVVSLIADPDTCPDLGELRDGVENEFRVMIEYPLDMGGQTGES